jgi:hypothetical protein
LSKNYAIQSREDESEALSGAASERLKLALAKSDAPTPRLNLLANVHLKGSQQKADSVVKLAQSDVDLWVHVIQNLNLQPSDTSSDILQHILQMNIASPDEITRMLPYATHLKVAAFAQRQKR